MPTDLKEAQLRDAITSKQSILVDRTKFKQATLSKPENILRDSLVASQRRYENARAVKAERERKALASDADLQSTAGEITNLAARGLSGGLRFAGWLATLPSTAQGALQLGGVDEKALNLYNQTTQNQKGNADLDQRLVDIDTAVSSGRLTKDQATVERAGITSERRFLTPLTDEENTYLDEKGKGQTTLSRRAALEQAGEQFDFSTAINKFVEESPIHDLVNPIGVAPLTEALDETFARHQKFFTASDAALGRGDYGEAAKQGYFGLANLIVDGLSDVMDNPAAAFEYIAENAPQLIAGGFSPVLLAASNIGYGADIYRQRIDEYKKEYGSFPTKTENIAILAASISASAMEQVADVSILKQFKNLPGSTAKVRKILDMALPVNKFTKAADVVIRNPLTKVAGAIASGAVKEGITETYQTAVEENLSKLNIDWAGARIFQGGIIGAVVGGAYSGGGRAGREVLNLAQKGAAKGIDIIETAQAKVEARRLAVETGDISALTDPESPSYDRIDALAVLVSRLDKVPAEEVEATQKQIAELLDTQKATLKAIVEETQKEMARDDADVDTAKVTRLTEELKQQKEVLTTMRTLRDIPLVKERATPEQIETIVEDAKTTPEPLIELMMKDPGSIEDTVTPAQIEAIVQSGDLTTVQKTFLENYTASHAKLNSLQDIKGVQSQVISGRDGFKGITQYEAEVGNAIRTENQDAAEAEIAELIEFGQDHANKEAAFKKALELQSVEIAKESGSRTVYVIRDAGAEKGWRVAIAAKKPEGFSKQNGGWVAKPSIKHRTGLVSTIAAIHDENTALRAAYKQLRAATDMAFTPGKTTVTEDVVTVEAPVEDIPLVDEAAAVVEPVTKADIPDAAVTAAVVSEPAIADATPTAEPQVEEEVEAADVVSEPKTEEIEIEKELSTVDEQLAAVEREVEAEELETESGIIEVDTAKRKKGNMSAEEYFSPDSDFLAAYFEQHDTDANPLVAIKDFLSLITKEEVDTRSTLLEFLEQDDVTDAGLKFFETFIEAARAWYPMIVKNVKGAKINPRFKGTDYTSLFQDRLTVNVTTAIAYAAFSWISENSGGTGKNSDAQIRAILGYDSDTRITEAERSLLEFVGFNEDLTIMDLGRRVREALNYRAHDEAPLDEDDKFDLAWGSQALVIMQQSGITARTTVVLPKTILKTAEKTAAMLDAGEIESGMELEPHGSLFVKISRDADGVPFEDARLISNLAEGSGAILSKLFSVEPGLRLPSDTPNSFDQTKTKTGTNVPSTQAAVQKKVSNRPQRFDKGMQLFRRVVSRATSGAVAGVVQLEGVLHHVASIKAIEARNDDLWRDLDRMESYEELLGDERFYVTPDVQKHQRVGQRSNVVNTQASKLQRHNIYMEEWVTEFVPGNNSPDEVYFRMAVAQGLGLRVDKQKIEVTEADLVTELAKPEIVAALEILKKARSLPEGEQLSDADQQVLVDVATVRENHATIQVLISQAEYDANISGEAFKTTLMYEVDGIANGPALAQVLMGTAAGLGPKFGMFDNTHSERSFFEWRGKPGNRDQYETILDGTLNYFRRGNKITDRALKLGPLFKLDRDTLKTPIQAMVFGSGLQTAISDIGNDILANYLTEIDKAAQAEGTDTERLVAIVGIINNINNLLPEKAHVEIPTNLTQALSESTAIKLYQETIIRENYYEYLGGPLEQVMKESFKQFIAVRKVLNQAAHGVQARYAVVYNHLYEKVLADTTPKHKSGRPLQDITRAAKQEIDRQVALMTPIMHTAMSRASNDLSAGLRFDKVDYSSVEPDSKIYAQEVHFGVPMPSNKAGDTQGPVSSITPTSSRRTSAPPGVATAILAVHSTESAIMTTAIGEIPALGIHDAGGAGVKDATRMALALNKATYFTLAGYSLPLEIFRALKRSMVATDVLVDLDPELREKLDAVNVGTADFPVAMNHSFLVKLELTALSAEVNKLDFLAKQEIMDQYALEGGSYEVTEDAKNRVLAKLAATRARRDALENVNKEKAAVAEALRKQEKAAAQRPETRNYPEDTPWGVVGNSKVDSDPQIVEWLEQNPKTTAVTFATWLRGNVVRDPFQRELLDQIIKSLNPKVKVLYATPVTTFRSVLTAQIKTARGLYSPEGNGLIVVKSPDFVTSGVTAEMAVHELMHAAVEQVIRDPEPGVAAKAAVADLNALFEAIKVNTAISTADHVKYTEAMSSVQEMVAWGMTNPEFQQDVLAKTKYKSTVKEHVKESGLRGFINNLVTIFFGVVGWTVARHNSMGALIGDVGLVLAAAHNRNATTERAPDLLMADPDPRTFTTAEIFDGLGATGNPRITDTQFSIHLKAVLQQVVDAGYGAASALRAAAQESAPATADEIYLTSLAAGSTPFTSQLTNLLRVTDQEAFVTEAVELTVRGALSGRHGGKISVIQKELQLIFNRAKIAIKPEDFYQGDWSKASATDRAQAEKTHALIFIVQREADGTSNYLSQFVAAALAYKPLHDKLAELTLPTDKEVLREKSFIDAIKLVFTRIKDIFTHFYTNTKPGQATDSVILTHAHNLATIEAKKAATLLVAKDSPATWLEQRSKAATDAIKRKVASIGQSKQFAESGSDSIRLIAKVTALAADAKADELYKGILKIRQHFTSERFGITAEVINEAFGTRDAVEWANQSLIQATSMQQQVSNAILDVGKLIRNSFAEDLTETQLSALTDILLRTDMSALLGDFTLTELEKLVSDPAVLEKAIASYENQLTSKHATEYILRGKTLGHHMATGKTMRQDMVLNVHNIAHMAVTPFRNTVSDVQADSVKVILDPLVSLYALRYSSIDTKNTISDLMRQEADPETVDNGIEFVLRLAEHMKQDALENNFMGDPVQMVKGYTKEIYNPHIAIKEVDAKVGAELEKAGYKRATNALPQDPTVSHAPRFLYTIRDGGITETTSSFLLKTDKKLKGTVVYGAVKGGSQNQAPTITNRNWDPAKATGNGFLVPTVNSRMEAANYRYMMESSTKDDLLERVNVIDKVMGGMAGSAINKAASPGLNENAIDAIKAIYDAEYLTNPAAFIEVGPLSHDETVRQHWLLLPVETRKYIRKTWGTNSMFVRTDVYNTAFGYHKYSIREVFQKSPEMQNHLERLLVSLLGQVEIPDPFDPQRITYIGSKRALKIVQAENVIQEMVKWVKDIWVIKNLFTLLGNESSNTTLLWFAGVPMHKILTGKILAYKAVMEYRSDLRKLHELQIKTNSQYLVGKAAAEAQQEIIQLEDALAKNAVRDLIDAGMFQTLIEDIGVDEDPYSYQTKLSKWIDKKTSLVPQGVKTATKIALVSHGTPLYEVLNKATTFSDFTSRYVMHQYLTTRKNNPLSRTESLRQSRAAFVNYDIPTHMAVQYLNDMGILWFTKYYLRIQAVIVFLIKNNPARALAIIGMNTLVGPFADILDSAAIGKSPVHLGAGPLELPEAFFDIITVNTLNKLI